MLYVLYFLCGALGMFAFLGYLQYYVLKYSPTLVVEPIVEPLLTLIAAHHTNIFVRFFERSGTILAPKELLTAIEDDTRAFETYQKEVEAILRGLPVKPPLYPEGHRGCEYVKIDEAAKVICVFGSEKYRLSVESPHTLQEVPVTLDGFSEYRFVFDKDLP